MDVCVTVPRGLWAAWVAEGDLPGQEPEYESHFWAQGPIPSMEPGDRVYVVAFGRLRGYAPLVAVEQRCALRPPMGCLVRRAGAVAVTIDRPIRGFRGWRYVDWSRADERPFPDWRTEGLPSTVADEIAEAFGPSAPERTARPPLQPSLLEA